LRKPSGFRDLVSGRRRGGWAALQRWGLRLAEVPYTWVVRWRNRRYDSRAARIHRVGVPVVSVGNLTLGGTGKTPMVEWLARWFRGHDVRVTVISRGYGAEAGAQNDETRELEARLPDVPHLQNPDRVAAARMAMEEFQCQVILLDDAFQHRRIARDLDLVLLDGLEPFGFGHVFPRGTLREPLCGLRRADVVALSRADLLDPAEREEIWRTVRRHAPQAAHLEVVHAAQSLISAGGQEEPLDRLAGRQVAAFCGIGNPAGFRHTLRTCGYQVIDFREFPDHHPYGPADIESLAAWADQLEVAAVVCTHKDLVKLAIDQLRGRPLRAIRIGLEFLAGREVLEAKLAGLLARATVS
jgi:tetraacyldisaccharide 4'-kinase